jgi:hypothetical protein
MSWPGRPVLTPRRSVAGWTGGPPGWRFPSWATHGRSSSSRTRTAPWLVLQMVQVGSDSSSHPDCEAPVSRRGVHARVMTSVSGAVTGIRTGPPRAPDRHRPRPPCPPSRGRGSMPRGHAAHVWQDSRARPCRRPCLARPRPHVHPDAGSGLVWPTDALAHTRTSGSVRTGPTASSVLPVGGGQPVGGSPSSSACCAATGS